MGTMMMYYGMLIGLVCGTGIGICLTVLFKNNGKNNKNNKDSEC